MHQHNPNLKPDSVDPKILNEWKRKYDPRMVKAFMQPAKVCQACGNPMDKDPKTGKAYNMTEKERRFSIHEQCRIDAFDFLDRQGGELSRRG